MISTLNDSWRQVKAIALASDKTRETRAASQAKRKLKTFYDVKLTS